MDSTARYDGALLAQLEERGSVELNEFVEYVRGVGDASWPGPPTDDVTRAWIREAVDRSLVRRDDEDEVLTITDDGRHRIRELLAAE